MPHTAWLCAQMYLASACMCSSSLSRLPPFLVNNQKVWLFWASSFHFQNRCSTWQIHTPLSSAGELSNWHSGLWLPPRLLVRGKRYSPIPVISLDGIHDVYVTEGTMNGLLILCETASYQCWNLSTMSTHSVVIIDNASIHHVQDVVDLIESQAGAKLFFYHPIHLT